MELSPSTGPPPRKRYRLFLTLAAVGLLSVVAFLWLRAQTDYHAKLEQELSIPQDRVGANAPFITTPDPIVEKMIELAKLTSDDIAYDLGCGDGRIIITAALKTGCRGVGFDIDPARVAEARGNVRLHGVEHLVEIREQDVFTVDMREADVALFYLLPWMTKKLIPQFQQMKPGSRLISHDFALGDIKYIPPDKTVTIRDGTRHENHYIHRWTVPLKLPAERTRP